MYLLQYQSKIVVAAIWDGITALGCCLTLHVAYYLAGYFWDFELMIKYICITMKGGILIKAN